MVHLASDSEVGLLFDSGNVTLKNCTVLINNKQSGISAKVLSTLFEMGRLSTEFIFRDNLP